MRIGLDAGGEAAVALDIPESAILMFSKRDRQVVGDAKRYARELAMDWDELSLERKKQILHEASAAGRLRKTKEDTHAVWREQIAELGWTPVRAWRSARRRSARPPSGGKQLMRRPPPPFRTSFS